MLVFAARMSRRREVSERKRRGGVGGCYAGNGVDTTLAARRAGYFVAVCAGHIGAVEDASRRV